jgi:hypothetical protein
MQNILFLQAILGPLKQLLLGRVAQVLLVVATLAGQVHSVPSRLVVVGLRETLLLAADGMVELLVVAALPQIKVICGVEVREQMEVTQLQGDILVVAGAQALVLQGGQVYWVAMAAQPALREASLAEAAVDQREVAAQGQGAWSTFG